MPTPEPIYTFTLPSTADDLPLKCRVYHPLNLASSLHSHASGDGGGDGVGLKCAVIAHPYAPLGGCYDDLVVLALVEEWVEGGWVVGTFNFRGAEGSEGKTSWSGKAEGGDMQSLVGFMVYYLHSLQGGLDTESLALETIPSISNFDTTQHTNEPNILTNTSPTTLLLAGYSYGSLILARLPPLRNILQTFQQAEPGTTPAEILLRSRTLAKQTTSSLQEPQTPSTPRGRQLRPTDGTSSPRRSLGASPITVGGEESDAASRRRSRDSRRSVDFVRRSLEAPAKLKARVRGPGSPGRIGRNVSGAGEVRIQSGSEGGRDVPQVGVRYLVVSPVLLPFTHQLCPPGPPSVFAGLRKTGDGDAQGGAEFLANPTLALFGSSDTFTASRRLKAWAEKMAARSEMEKFEWREIEGAGHFWHEHGVMRELKRCVGKWAGRS